MPSKGKDVVGRAKQMGKTAAGALDVVENRAEKKAEKKFDGSTRYGRVRQAQTVLTIVTLGILGIIGVLIYSQVSTSLPAPEDAQLQNASDDIDGGFADALGLLPIVLIVMMAALVIAVVQRFRN